MAFTRSPLSLAANTTKAVNGRAVQLRGAQASKSFTMTITSVNSTKLSVRAQGSVDGVNWINIGGAATTFSSTSSPKTISNSTSNAFRIVRIALLSMVASTKGAVSAVGSITGG